MQLGGSGEVDRFAEQIWPIWRELLPEDPPVFQDVTSLLDEFRGDAWDDVTANDLDDGYVLANRCHSPAIALSQHFVSYRMNWL